MINLTKLNYETIVMPFIEVNDRLCKFTSLTGTGDDGSIYYLMIDKDYKLFVLNHHVEYDCDGIFTDFYILDEISDVEFKDNHGVIDFNDLFWQLGCYKW